jgi:nucleoside-diphosphate-sugar epimerase
MSTNNTSPSSVLMTGASGFVGSRLTCALLEKGRTVHALRIPGCDVSQLPLSHPCLRLHSASDTTETLAAILREASPQVVVHLASLFLSDHGPGDIGNLIDSNVKLGTALLDAMRLVGVRRFVNTGTSWQHYRDAAYSPVNLYAATKQAFEDILTYYVEAHGFNAITLQLFDTYGPGDPRTKLLNLLLRAAKNNEPLTMSPGEQLLDLVHVDDVCRAFVGAIEILEGEEPLGRHSIYAVSSGARMSLRDVVNVFNRVARVQASVEWGAHPYRQREVMMPWASGKSVPGWKPLISLEQGIRAMTWP